MKKRASKVAHNRPRPFYFTVQPRPTAHSPELIFHIMKSWDQTSVLLSVDKSLKFEFWSWEISKDFERLKSCHIKGSEMSLEAQIRLHFAILAFRATSSCYLRWVEPSKISQIQIQVRENNKVHLFEEMHQYSCNKITTTWIQIFRQNWNVFPKMIAIRSYSF